MGIRSLEIRRRQFLAASLCLPILGLGGMPASAVPESLEGQALDRRIGEMVVIGFVGDSPDSPGCKAVAEWLRAGLVGGVIFFEDNLSSPHAAKALTRFFAQAASPRTPFLCVDQEGGAVSRLNPEKGFTALPSAAKVAKGTLEDAFATYDRAAGELRRLGFNVNFAPVVDLAINEGSRVIYEPERSFGADPRKVADYAKALIEAHRRNHVLTALKHFPGHGSTALDSHRQLPDITASWRKEELAPFVELTNNGLADMVMVGHLVHAGLTEPGRPASLSARTVTGLLRERLGFTGVVVSDDMQMDAVRNTFSPDEAIELGVGAGVDLFIYSNRRHVDPQMPGRFQRVVRAAIAAGKLSPDRIGASAARLSVLRRAIEFANAQLATEVR